MSGRVPSAKADRDVYHALDYLTYASLQLGRDAEARKWVEFVQSNQTLNEQTRQIAYAAAAIPARFALERGEWAKAAQLALRPVSPAFDWTPFPEGEAVNAYARGLGAARSGNATAAKAEVARLGKLREAMVVQKKDYWIEQADIQVDAIRAWIARAEGQNDEAVRLMRAAADREDRTEEHLMMPGRSHPGPRDARRAVARAEAAERCARGVRGIAAGRSQALPQRLWRGTCRRARRQARQGQDELRATASAGRPERDGPS